MKIFILGASSDIGVEACKKFIHEGWNVLAHCRNLNSELERLKAKSRGMLEVISFDLHDLCANEIVLSSYDNAILECDSFVNCASIYIPKNIYQIDAKNLIEHFSINVVPSFLVIKKIIPKMIERGFGRILNLSSIGVKYGGGAESLGYSLSKHSLEFIPKECINWAKNNVFINTIRVGVTNTKIHKLNPNKSMVERISLIPAKRMAETSEIAKMIWNLSSSENTYVTGQIITIAGGE